MTSLAQRHAILILIAEAVSAGARCARACELLGVSTRTLARWRLDRGGGDGRPRRIQNPRNRFSVLERERILAVVNNGEYAALAPSQIVPRLADKGVYLASESTIYRLLRARHQLAHRTPDRPRQTLVRPRALAASAPRQLFSWDITYLPAAVRGQYYYLYLFLDLFSRRIVGWQVYDTEDGARAGALMREVCRSEGIAPGQLVLHSDNGAPMKGATMLQTLRDLGVAPSFSRPAVSDDNPYSESLFRTMKYRPRYPRATFADLRAARAWVGAFVAWYNGEHRHSAIGFVTPDQRHHGQDRALLAARRAVYEAARAKHPERWSGAIRDWSWVAVVHLNPQKENTATTHSTPTLERAARALRKMRQLA